jgi:uncharacterized iron-regulated membrane protein
MTFRKFIGQLHLWLGLASGLVVFVVSLTGCLYVFEAEIQSLYNGSYTRVAAQTQPPLPVSALQRIGQQSLRKAIGRPVRAEYATVNVYNAPTKAAYYYAYGQAGKLYHYVHLNPYTGQVLRVRDMNRDPFTVIINLHTRLLLPYDVGHRVVGVAVLVFVVSLLTGLVLWWPRNRAALKQRFSVKWSAKWRRVNYDSHNVFGFYSLLPALLIAVTGLVWSFSWVDKGVYFLLTGRADAATHQEPRSGRRETRAGNVLDRVLDRTVARYPAAAYYAVALPVADTSTVAVRVYPSEQTYYDGTTLHFDQYTGHLLKTEGPAQQNLGQKARAMNYDIHIGKILGLPGQLLAFFAALVSASLPVTGCLVWWGRRRKGRRPVAPVAARHRTTTTASQTAL